MLLRRFTENVRDQNWFAVGLDFLVVVVGIYVGLQADEWNEQRKDRIREQAHLEQLYSDFAFNAHRAEAAAVHHADLARELMFAVGVIVRGQLREDESERFKWAILTMLQAPPSGMTSAGYDAMLASGDFAILRDQELKSRLVKIHSEVELEQVYLDKFFQRPNVPAEIGEQAITMVPHPSGKGGLWQVDFDALKNYPGTLATLANMRRNHQMTSEQYRRVGSEFVDLRLYIGQILGKQ